MQNGSHLIEIHINLNFNQTVTWKKTKLLREKLEIQFHVLNIGDDEIAISFK